MWFHLNRHPLPLLCIHLSCGCQSFTACQPIQRLQSMFREWYLIYRRISSQFPTTSALLPLHTWRMDSLKVGRIAPLSAATFIVLLRRTPSVRRSLVGCKPLPGKLKSSPLAPFVQLTVKQKIRHGNHYIWCVSLQLLLHNTSTRPIHSWSTSPPLLCSPQFTLQTAQNFYFYPPTDDNLIMSSLRPGAVQ